MNILADGQLQWAGLTGAEEPYLPFYMFSQAADTWTDPETGITYQGDGVPINRWRRAYQNDFEARMDWGVKPYSEANHNPVAAFEGDLSDGIIHYSTSPGNLAVLDASASMDPDGDGLTFRWYAYPEAGTYKGNVRINDNATPVARVQIPADAAGKQIHVILEVRDDNKIVPLYDYRRIIFNIE